ncbi:MAG TPA: hypothetical protein ENH96_02865 [Chlamydiae bacterium]|nr:hypothetical protein [Chlamydiota bacterium]
MKAMFSSNFIEILIRKLKQNLFFSGLKSEVYIFVPNKFVKNYLMQNFADDPDLKISFGLNFVNISNFLNFFQNKLKISKDKRFLNFLELNFLIRKKIIEHIEKPNNHLSNSLYLDLRKYLIKDDKIIEKRLTKLSYDLTEIYLKYSIFENEKNLIEKSKNHWQIRLFLEIFYEDKYSLVFRDLNKIDIQSIKNIEFHFFSLSYMPPIYFDFINKFENVFHYFISPTNYFFEDFLSNFERKNLKKHLIEKQNSHEQIVELDSYLKDRNSFLANMEKLKRNYLKIISSYDDIAVYDEYERVDQEKLDIDEKRSFLNLFQDDIFNLENREDNLKSLEKADDSIQVHVATSKLREVQVLYSNILKLLKNDKDLKPSDIHVISKNIDEYASYIEMVFESDKNSLNYKISDLKITDESFFITGFEKLIKLSNSRFEKEDILDLFENPLFIHSHKFSAGEIKILFKWIEKANISWGLDEKHILKFLKDSDLAILKSFEKGIARIFLSAIFVLNQNFLDSSFSFDYPVSELEISDLRVLDKFLKTLISIYNDLKIIEDKKSLTIDEWQKYLKKLSINNLRNFQNLNMIIDKEKSFIEKTAFESFQNYLEDLKNVSFNFDQTKFSFEVIFDHLKKHLSKLRVDRHKNSIEAIYFSSFEMSYLPAKAIFILGLDDESLQIKTKSSIDISNLKNVPSNADHERSLFLQSLLNAKKYLILSYISKENQKIDKAIFLEEFLSYLDRSYKILNQKPSKCIIKKHPPFSFHKSYFTKDNDSFSKKNYKAALCYYKEKPKQGKDHINVKPFDIDIKKETSKIIDLRHLKQLCKNPISFYLNKMDIYLEEEEEKNDFKISNLDKYIIKNAVIKDDIVDDILYSFEKRAKMPVGVFNDIAKSKIRSDIFIFLQNLKDLEVDYKNLINIEFSLDAKNIEKIDSKNIVMPPIEIKGDQETIKIIGRIENISNKGLLSHLDDKLYSQIRMWPDILILNKLDKNFEKKIIFTKSKTIKSYKINRVDECLLELIKYYDLSQREISFMIKPFCEHILNKEESNLDKALKRTDKKNIFLDVYSTWYFKNFEKPEAKNLIEKSKIIKNVFQPLLEQN